MFEVAKFVPAKNGVVLFIFYKILGSNVVLLIIYPFLSFPIGLLFLPNGRKEDSWISL